MRKAKRTAQHVFPGGSTAINGTAWSVASVRRSPATASRCINVLWCPSLSWPKWTVQSASRPPADTHPHKDRSGKLQATVQSGSHAKQERAQRPSRALHASLHSGSGILYLRSAGLIVNLGPGSRVPPPPPTVPSAHVDTSIGSRIDPFLLQHYTRLVVLGSCQSRTASRAARASP